MVIEHWSSQKLLCGVKKSDCVKTVLTIASYECPTMIQCSVLNGRHSPSQYSYMPKLCCVKKIPLVSALTQGSRRWLSDMEKTMQNSPGLAFPY